MTRLIAGRLRSTRLAVPDAGTRPTTDRVREAMFSAIESRLELDGTFVLDLFAGSGALGLEAVSRGAETADFFESAGPAARVLQRNIDTARNALELPRADLALHRTTLPGAVSGPCPRAGGFDLVLIDPPYEQVEQLVPEILDRLIACAWLSDIAHVVVESSVRSAVIEWPQGMTWEFSRNYGETRVDIGAREDR